MKIVLNAGHTLTGAGSGAVGHINESQETRRLVRAVKHYLTGKGHEVIIDTIDKANSQGAYLWAVCDRANKTDADLFVSIHFNAGGGRGTECYTWKGRKTDAALGICKNLERLGFRNRGVKDGSRFYVISKTRMPAVLVEVCFVDSKEDCDLYKEAGVNIVAQALTRGILN